MENVRYEIVEKDRSAQQRILAGLADSPAQGVAYMMMMSGEALSTSDITSFLSLTDEWFLRQFEEAVVELEVNGLIRSLDNQPAGAEEEPEWLVSWEELLPQDISVCCTS